MKKPATAGKILSEEQLRAFLKCSELYHFGGTFSHTPKLAVTKYAYEKLVTSLIRKPEIDIAKTMVQGINEGIRKNKELEDYRDQDIEQIRRGAILTLNEVLRAFPIDNYIPICGPVPCRINISKTPIVLNISAVFRSRNNQSIHFVDFAPYSNTHDLAWDIPTHIKIKYLSTFVPAHSSRKADAVGHIFGLTDRADLSHTIIEDKTLNPKFYERAVRVVKLIEAGYHMPVLPCAFACPYKKSCKP